MASSTPQRQRGPPTVTLTKIQSQPFRPKLYFMRHAESKAKEYDPGAKHTILDHTLIDPKLSPRGLQQCATIAGFFKDHGINPTHILSTPLSRGLDTACLAFPELIEKGILVRARAELQTMDCFQNGTGLRLQALAKIYGYEAGYAKRQEQRMAQSTESKLHDNYDERSELGGDVRRTRDFRGYVDLSCLAEDWNDPKHRCLDGKYGTDEKRQGEFKAFLDGLLKAKMPRERLEVLVVSHSSFIGPWIADDVWENYEICLWRFRLAPDGELREEGSKPRIMRIQPGECANLSLRTNRQPIPSPAVQLSDESEKLVREEMVKMRALQQLQQGMRKRAPEDLDWVVADNLDNS